MVFLATYWWVTLILALVCSGAAIGFQLKNMSRMVKNFEFPIMGMIPVVIFGLGSTAMWILTAIGIVAALVGTK